MLTFLTKKVSFFNSRGEIAGTMATCLDISRRLPGTKTIQLEIMKVNLKGSDNV